jgi:hypothetical protein
MFIVLAKTIASIALGIVTLTSASAAASYTDATHPGASLRTQRIEFRRAQRQHRDTSSSTAPLRWSRPSRRAMSSSSYSYTGTPVRGVLQIDQVATARSQQIVGTVPYTLLSFDATAGNEDIVLSTVKFRAEQGSLSTGTQYTLGTVDEAGTLTPVAYATSSADVLAFTNINTIIHKDTTQRFVLRGRLIDANASLAVGFFKTDPLFIQAQGLQYGRDLAPGIQVDTTPCTSAYVCRVYVHTQPGMLLYK